MTIPTWLFWVGVVGLVCNVAIPALIALVSLHIPLTLPKARSAKISVIVLALLPLYIWVAAWEYAEANWFDNPIEELIPLLESTGFQIRDRQFKTYECTEEYVGFATMATKMKTQPIDGAFFTPDGTIISADANLVKLNEHFLDTKRPSNVIDAVVNAEGTGITMVTESGQLYCLGDVPQLKSLADERLAGLAAIRPRVRRKTPEHGLRPLRRENTRRAVLKPAVAVEANEAGAEVSPAAEPAD